MRSWRNWQTRKTKDLVGNSMQVQFLSTAPKSAIFERKRLESADFLLLSAARAVEIWGRFGEVFARSRALPSVELLALFQKVFVRKIGVSISENAERMPHEMISRRVCYVVLFAPCIKRSAEVVELMPGQGSFEMAAEHIKVGDIEHAVGG